MRSRAQLAAFEVGDGSEVGPTEGGLVGLVKRRAHEQPTFAQLVSVLERSVAFTERGQRGDPQTFEPPFPVDRISTVSDKRARPASALLWSATPAGTLDLSIASLRAVHADVSIHGWLDAWYLGWAWFDWGEIRREGGKASSVANGQFCGLRRSTKSPLCRYGRVKVHTSVPTGVNARARRGSPVPIGAEPFR